MAFMLSDTQPITPTFAEVDSDGANSAHERATTDQAGSPFIDSLPRELRNSIYSFVIASQMEHVHLNTRSKIPANVHSSRHPLLAVSQQTNTGITEQFSLELPLETVVTVDKLKFDGAMKGLKAGAIVDPGFIAHYRNVNGQPRLRCRLSFSNNDFNTCKLGTWVAFVRRHALHIKYEVLADKAPTNEDFIHQLLNIHGNASRGSPVELASIFAPFKEWRVAEH